MYGGRIMGIGSIIMEIATPIMELFVPIIPGDIFPYFFGETINGEPLEMFQRALITALMVTIVAGVLGSFLLIRNLALIGDGLAHVSFGGIAVGVVLGATSPLWYALLFSTIAAILIHELQTREILTGDAAIAIFLTGMLALGLVILRLDVAFDVPFFGPLELNGGGITTDIEGYLFGNLLLIDEQSLDLISLISIISLISLVVMRSMLLAIAIDPLAARVQGIPVRIIGICFSIITAAVVVSMVQVVGTLLVTALLVTPAATAQLVGRSFRSCMIWTQIFGLLSVLIGLYYSAELDTGSGSMIALVSALIFALTAIIIGIKNSFFSPRDNTN